jgi:hypothetical protein
MVIFDAQANAGKALQRFTDWLIDREWLAEVHEQQKDLLDAEGLSPDGLIDLLGRACTLGFAVAEPAGWRLLPAVCRYLDHFEGLAAASEMTTNETCCTEETRRRAERRGDRLMQHGFQRLVLLGSAGYSRAELPLDGAVSLVAPNNTGKTSLINALQFLLIIDRRRMDFGAHDVEKSRRFYFPNNSAYVLLEVSLPESGTVVLGASARA